MVNIIPQEPWVCKLSLDFNSIDNDDETCDSAAGWVLAAFAIFQIPLWGAYVVYNQNESTWQKVFSSST